MAGEDDRPERSGIPHAWPAEAYVSAATNALTKAESAATRPNGAADALAMAAIAQGWATLALAVVTAERT